MKKDSWMIEDNLGNRHKQIYTYLKQSKGSLTNTEIAKGLKLPINQITPRINELRKMRFVILAGRRKCSVTNKTVKIWQINKNRKKEKFDVTDLL